MRSLERHFDAALTAPNGVEKLRELILRLAIKGKLTLQNSEDQPTSELMKEIVAEKQRLQKTGKVKKTKVIAEKELDKSPYKLPIGWEWVRFGTLVLEYQNGLSKRRSSVGTETVVLRLADIRNNEISLSETRSIQLSKEEIEKYRLIDKDLLVTRVNGSIDLVGSFVRIRGEDTVVTYCDHFIRARLPVEKIDVDYIHILSKSSFVRQQIESKFVTTAGQKTVNQNHIGTLLAD